MDLSTYKFPEVSPADLVFPTFNVTKELLDEASKRDIRRGIDKFNQLFYSGGEVKIKKDVAGTWKENAWRYTKCLMGSWAPKHEHKEAVCAMLIEECLEL